MSPESNNKQPSFEIVDFLIEDAQNNEDINKIIRWSSRESMVSISLGSIATHRFPKSAYLTNGDTDDSQRTLIGYGAISHIYSKDVLELGGLVVSQDLRGLGIASKIVKSVVSDAVEAMDPELILAFTNPTSSSIFARLGGTQIEDARSLPPEVWKVCHLCRFYDEATACGQECCGRVYDITNITEEA